MSIINESNDEEKLMAENSQEGATEETLFDEATNQIEKEESAQEEEEDKDKADEPTQEMESQKETLKAKKALNVGKSGVVYEDEVLREQIKY